MKIAVCMKYVPDDMSRDIDEKSGGIKRTEENSTINQADIFALETALFMRKKHGGSITVYTMGPDFAANLLREACALGADELNLISDRKIAGSDSYCTAFVLAAALKDKFDIVLCGERSVDGETGQVPGALSAMLELPFVYGVIGIDKLSDGEIICRRLSDEGEDFVSLPLPAVMSISCGMTGVNHPMRPSLEGLRMARNMQHNILNLDLLGLDPAQVGLSGSPTRVAKTVVPDWSRQCRVFHNLEQGVRMSLEVLRE